MVLADRPPSAIASAAISDAVRAIFQFIGELWSIRSVERVSVSTDSGAVDVWVLLEPEDLEVAEKIFLLERECRQIVGEFPMEIHVVALSEINPDLLPSARIIFDRSAGAISAQPH